MNAIYVSTSLYSSCRSLFTYKYFDLFICAFNHMQIVLHLANSTVKTHNMHSQHIMTLKIHNMRSKGTLPLFFCIKIFALAEGNTLHTMMTTMSIFQSEFCALNNVWWCFLPQMYQSHLFTGLSTTTGCFGLK